MRFTGRAPTRAGSSAPHLRGLDDQRVVVPGSSSWASTGPASPPGGTARIHAAARGHLHHQERRAVAAPRDGVGLCLLGHGP